MKCRWVSNSNVFFLLQQFSVVFVDMCCSLRSKCTTTSLWCRGRAACHGTFVLFDSWKNMARSPRFARTEVLKLLKALQFEIAASWASMWRGMLQENWFWVNKQHIFWWTSFCEFLLGWLNNMHFCLVLKNFRSSQIKTKSVSLCNHVWCQHLRAPAWWGWKVACNMFCRSWGQKSCRTMP